MLKFEKICVEKNVDIYHFGKIRKEVYALKRPGLSLVLLYGNFINIFLV